MASKWCQVRLGDVIEIISGGTPKTNIPEYWGGEIPWLSVADFNTGYRWVSNAEKCITELGVSKSATTVLRKGDIIISARGTVGALAQLSKPMAFNQSCYGIRGKDKISDTDYIYYALTYAVSSMKRVAHGGVFDTITRDTFKLINLNIPTLLEQRAIAYILGTLDDKIELNRQMNETLEEMARTLFKSWFIDFDPVRAKVDGRWKCGQSLPGLPARLYGHFPNNLSDSNIGKIPAQWQIRSLDEIAEFLNGLALQKYPAHDFSNSLPVIKIAELRNGVNSSSDRASREVPNKYIIRDGDFLFSWSGSLLAKFWTGGEGALNQHLFKVTSNEYPMWFVSRWVLHHLSEFQFIAASKATTMGHIQRSHLKAAMTVCPPSSTMKVLGNSIEPLIERSIQNYLESRTLLNLRNTLLPKLISGELRIKDAERIIGDAT